MYQRQLFGMFLLSYLLGGFREEIDDFQDFSIFLPILYFYNGIVGSYSLASFYYKFPLWFRVLLLGSLKDSELAVVGS